MLAAWRATTRVDASAVKTNGTASWRLVLSSPAPSVAVPAAVSDPTDMVRLRASAPRPPTVAHVAALGDTMSNPPNAVATALPPRNRAKTGHECPTHAASPAAACAVGSAPQRRASPIAAAPLATSRAKVSAPGPGADGAQHVGGAHVAAAEIADVEAANSLSHDQAERHRSDQISGGAARRIGSVASHARSSLAPHHVGAQQRDPG